MGFFWGLCAAWRQVPASQIRRREYHRISSCCADNCRRKKHWTSPWVPLLSVVFVPTWVEVRFSLQTIGATLYPYRFYMILLTGGPIQLTGGPGSMAPLESRAIRGIQAPIKRIPYRSSRRGQKPRDRGETTWDDSCERRKVLRKTSGKSSMLSKNIHKVTNYFLMLQTGWYLPVYHTVLQQLPMFMGH